MWKLLLGSLSLNLLLGACQAQPIMQLLAPSRVSGTAQITTRAITDSRYSYSSDRTELVVTMSHDTGESIEYSLVRRPLEGFSVVAQTTVRRSTTVVSVSRTTPAEAQLVLKTAANNGWQEVYRDLKERYRLTGLVN